MDTSEDTKKNLANIWMTKITPQIEYFDREDIPYGIFKFNELSLWYERPVVIDGISYSSSGQYMMVEKAKLFNDKSALKKIMKAKCPGILKELGQKIRKVDQNVWEEYCFDIAAKVNYHKFKEHLDLKVKLMNTGRKLLVNGDADDKLWGIGIDVNDQGAQDLMQWNGSNLLGQAMMLVRSKILKEENKEFRNAIGDYSCPDRWENKLATDRLRKELRLLKREKSPQFNAEPINDNLYLWNAYIQGPRDSPYEGGLFHLRLRYFTDYPHIPPEVTFITKVFHPNIQDNGKVWLDILSDSWYQSLTLSSLLASIIALMAEPTPVDSFHVAAVIYKENKPWFDEMAKAWTRNYATEFKMYNEPCLI